MVTIIMMIITITTEAAVVVAVIIGIIMAGIIDKMIKATPISSLNME